MFMLSIVQAIFQGFPSCSPELLHLTKLSPYLGFPAGNFWISSMRTNMLVLNCVPFLGAQLSIILLIEHSAVLEYLVWVNICTFDSQTKGAVMICFWAIVIHVCLPETNSSRNNKPLLADFLAETIRDKDYNPSIIRWLNKEDGVFLIVKPKKIAELWGIRKGNPKMNYPSMSRGIRYVIHTVSRIIIWNLDHVQQ